MDKLVPALPIGLFPSRHCNMLLVFFGNCAILSIGKVWTSHATLYLILYT